MRPTIIVHASDVEGEGWGSGEVNKSFVVTVVSNGVNKRVKTDDTNIK